MLFDLPFVGLVVFSPVFGSAFFLSAAAFTDLDAAGF